MNPVLSIVFEERPSDWIAYLADRPTLWDAGTTKEEAVVKLLISLQAAGVVSIKRKERYDHRPTNQ